MKVSQFYIDGEWVEPTSTDWITVTNPATEGHICDLAAGSAQDVDNAVAAAKRAFKTFSLTTREERLRLLERLLEEYNNRYQEIAEAVSHEMGAPIEFARNAQARSGSSHLEITIQALRKFEFFEDRGSTRIVKEGIGVAALITPWNWPLNQIVAKVAPAIAAGCTMVLKPSELAPLSALVFAEAIAAAGFPKGVFNLVNGDGVSVGAPLSAHPDIDIVSFTGSTRAGVAIAKAAADTIKRVCQELGGKSANIILSDENFEKAVSRGVDAVMSNSGQSCDAPTRMLVPAERHAEALEIAREAALAQKVGDPNNSATSMGPVVSKVQYDKIQALISHGIDEGATLVTGGLGRPVGLMKGFYVQPTVFGGVTRAMRIAREEIFGPVLSIMPYQTLPEAVDIANDTPYGLAAYIQSQDLDVAKKIASQMRAGSVHLNYPAFDAAAPFGGYKQSGNGRESADFGICEYLETKSIVGFHNE